MDFLEGNVSTGLENSTISLPQTEAEGPEIPIIDNDEPLVEVVPKLSNYITRAVPVTYSFDQLRYSSHGQNLRSLVDSLAEGSHNPFIVTALMILKWQFDNSSEADWGLNKGRGYACEYVGWQFLCHLTQRETIEYLLEELPYPPRNSISLSQAEIGASGFASSMGDQENQPGGERTPLLQSSSSSLYRFFGGNRNTGSYSEGTQTGQNSQYDAYRLGRYSLFFGLNALEIATIAEAKSFLSQKVVQRVIDNIWKGEIVFWDTLSVHSKKKAHFFNKRTADPYSRLRVPVYRKAFEALFFVSFLALYYAVLVERSPNGIGNFEMLMYIWIAAFAYDELSGMTDAGMLFYRMDFWSIWNMGIIGTGLAFVITRIVGLSKSDESIIEISFDVLSLEALFLVPRICSLVSLNPYFGSMIPVLKEMTKAFFKFVPVIVVLYIGFLTTFTMLARDRISLSQMSWLLVKVFFGSNVLGFDIAHDISPIFGFPLVLIFVSMTNLLLISSLVSLMSMSLEGVMAHAREEYLFQLSIYVLESSNSRRLTYFMPPLNLIPLLCIRPMRLFLSAESIRRVRIILLRATHLPFVVMIWAYESSRRYISRRNTVIPPMTTARGGSSRPTSSIQTSLSLSTRYAPLHPSATDAQQSSLGIGNKKGRTPSTTHPGPYPEARGSEPGQSGRVEIADVIDEVERLRSQVGRVAAMLASQQRSQS